MAKPPKGVGLIKTVSTCGSQLVLKEPDECFKPFISKVLRDTGGSSSFILASVLQLTPQSACDMSTVVRGIGMSFVPAPLHSIHVQSKLASGCFPVAVRACFPVDFIMGNDIAG